MMNLKPCPFCGGTNVDCRFSEVLKRAYALCYDCDANGPTASTDAAAVDAWNTRSGEDSLRAEGEKLKLERDVAKWPT